MKYSSSLTSYPVFPDWVFEGELPIDENITNAILSEVQLQMDGPNVHHTPFGWISNKGVVLGKNTLKLNSLIGTMFINNVAPHFRLNKQLTSQIEICESWMMGIKPTYNFPQDIHKHRWYHAVVFLKADQKGSKLLLDQFGVKRYTNPTDVQPNEHLIEAKQNKIIFFPTHLPWGFTPNHSANDTLIFCNSFIIKR